MLRSAISTMFSQPDPNLVMRNTATLESYRRWNRETMRRGLYFYLFSTLLFFSGALAMSLGAIDVLVRHHTARIWLFGSGEAALLIGAGLQVYALVRVMRYRKAHPWTPGA